MLSNLWLYSHFQKWIKEILQSLKKLYLYEPRNPFLFIRPFTKSNIDFVIGKLVCFSIQFQSPIGLISRKNNSPFLPCIKSMLETSNPNFLLNLTHNFSIFLPRLISENINSFSFILCKSEKSRFFPIVEILHENVLSFTTVTRISESFSIFF